MRELKQFKFIIFLISILCISSCSSTIKLFEGATPPPEDFTKFMLTVPDERILSPGDKITISIWGHDDLSIGSINQAFVTQEGTGRWVALDKAGEVNLPRLGKVRLGGYNTKEAELQLSKLYTVHIVDPIINIRILNHFVTILGEVESPGQYSMDGEAMRLIELLGKSGGFSKYAEMSNVQLIRYIQGKPYNFRIDLTSFEEFNNKNAFIKPDDVVYIPPMEKKRNDESLSQAIGIASIVTTIALIVSLFKK